MAFPNNLFSRVTEQLRCIELKKSAELSAGFRFCDYLGVDLNPGVYLLEPMSGFKSALGKFLRGHYFGSVSDTLGGDFDHGKIMRSFCPRTVKVWPPEVPGIGK